MHSVAAGARRSVCRVTRARSAALVRWSRTRGVIDATSRPTTLTTAGRLDCATAWPAVNTTSVHESALRSTPVANADVFGTSLNITPIYSLEI